ncbi:MAG: ubiquitin-like protein Pup [Acidimicrobiales bacterium]|nr:ubiquitin-like protein Pup [Acidimicrobiales bacterium]|tara:strand:- start:137 stop:346 length:210 start_codon:yes stop_codon:yes gene_type:complete
MAEKQEYFDSDDEGRGESVTGETLPNAESENVNSNELTSDLDDLLDEIDQVLETNAEEFVKSYVQKGGQ